MYSKDDADYWRVPRFLWRKSFRRENLGMVQSTEFWKSEVLIPIPFALNLLTYYHLLIMIPAFMITVTLHLYKSALYYRYGYQLHNKII